jgi:hypothetical protein
MNPVTASPTDLWLKRLTTAALLVLVAALIGLAIAFYGPGVHAQGLTRASHPKVAEGDVP